MAKLSYNFMRRARGSSLINRPPRSQIGRPFIKGWKYWSYLKENLSEFSYVARTMYSFFLVVFLEIAESFWVKFPRKLSGGKHPAWKIPDWVIHVRLNYMQLIAGLCAQKWQIIVIIVLPVQLLHANTLTKSGSLLLLTEEYQGQCVISFRGDYNVRWLFFYITEISIESLMECFQRHYEA